MQHPTEIAIALNKTEVQVNLGMDTDPGLMGLQGQNDRFNDSIADSVLGCRQDTLSPIIVLYN
ncbi:MAG: hypothetical protein ACKPEN_10310 [Planktothrix sp.]|uniref:hypothetical protein n=1 Tax=Planktothrix sp. TaxID=3088171 RepID=UPI0038D46C41